MKPMMQKQKATHRYLSADRMVGRIEALAKCSASAGPGVTRLSFTRESEAAYQLVAGWMRDAGMTVRRDEAGNLIGRYEGTRTDAPVLLIGSHLDSVIEAGKYDGILGVIAGLEVVQALDEGGVRPEHPIEVIAFCDEEGARFHTTLLGSRAICGMLGREDLEAKDEKGVTLATAMKEVGLDPERIHLATRSPRQLLGYLELHIEQGPVLEKMDQACGIVTGIAGQSRLRFLVKGSAGHAGTVPISMRKDALVGTAEMVHSMERIALQYPSLVATVGQLSVHPGASNVIPGQVEGTLDIRSIDDKARLEALDRMMDTCQLIAGRRGLNCEFTKIMESSAVACSEPMIRTIGSVFQDHGMKPIQLVSGAGHDAMAVSSLTEMGMIFVRCKGGISHHPDEAVTPEDMKTGAAILLDVTLQLVS